MILTEADAANLLLLGHQHAALRRRLESAVIVSSGAVPADVVTMQSQVALTDEAGKLHVLSVVYPQEADEASARISVLEPLGMALLGARCGQKIECPGARGPRRFRVEEIVYQPELSLRNDLVVRET